MKKFGCFVLGGIENRVLALVLVSMFPAGIVYPLSIVAQDNMLLRLSRETSERQLASMTGSTTEVLDSGIVQNMDRIKIYHTESNSAEKICSDIICFESRSCCPPCFQKKGQAFTCPSEGSMESRYVLSVIISGFQMKQALLRRIFC